MWILYDKFNPSKNRSFPDEDSAKEHRHAKCLDDQTQCIEFVPPDTHDTWLLCKTLAAPQEPRRMTFDEFCRKQY